MKKLTREQVEKIVKAAREKQEQPNLRGADLSDVYLNQADLSLADLGGANLPEDMKIGDKIRTTIDRSIRLHDKLLLILSQHSINSLWVEKEVETAFEEESKRNQTVLFPICLDQTIINTDQAWAADIRRTRHIGDFSQWQDQDKYQPGFERLLRDLAASEETPPTLPPRFAERTKDDTIDSLRRQLARHHSSLNKLREDAAIYGAGEVPLRLQNQMEDKELKIAEIEAELAEIEGEAD